MVSYYGQEAYCPEADGSGDIACSWRLVVQRSTVWSDIGDYSGALSCDAGVSGCRESMQPVYSETMCLQEEQTR